jgi:hypothetical protein
MTLYVGTDLLLQVSGLKDQDDNAVTGATVEATVFESDASTEVSGVTWPVTLSDDGGGDYSAVLEDTMALDNGRLYWIKVEITGSGADDTRWESFVAERRGFDD